MFATIKLAQIHRQGSDPPSGNRQVRTSGQSCRFARSCAMAYLTVKQRQANGSSRRIATANPTFRKRPVLRAQGGKAAGPHLRSENWLLNDREGSCLHLWTDPCRRLARSPLQPGQEPRRRYSCRHVAAGTLPGTGGVLTETTQCSSLPDFTMVPGKDPAGALTPSCGILTALQ